MKTKKCPICSNQFTAKRQDAIYCSKKCQVKAYRLRLKDADRNKLPQNAEPMEKVFDINLNDPASALNEFMKMLKEVIMKTEMAIESKSNVNSQKEQYLVPSQACSLLSINRSTFDRFVKEGIFKVYRLGKGKVYVKRSEIDQLFVNHSCIDYKSSD